jgi:hypothetical protein
MKRTIGYKPISVNARYATCATCHKRQPIARFSCYVYSASSTILYRNLNCVDCHALSYELVGITLKKETP